MVTQELGRLQQRFTTIDDLSSSKCEMRALCQSTNEISRMNKACILLPSRKNLGNNGEIGCIKRLYKLRKEGFCAAIHMRLINSYQATLWIAPTHRLQGHSNSGWMVSIIIDQ